MSGANRDNIKPEVKKVMKLLSGQPRKELREALYRTGLLYPLQTGPSIAHDTNAASPGSWILWTYCIRFVVADLKSDRRYRICSSKGSHVGIDIYVDGVKNGAPLEPGQCRDVEGKKIELHSSVEGYIEGPDAEGTYQNLD
ncbi:MAG: hypothetical protein QXJ74_06980 [Nitrososphaera sp.]|uniref:hypothetical protein n=1 Tax=Nitrososphaera sp. TaxID=1971748 RepID=UPI00182A4486|nr:hypothetical protein [Nitrososphaera sp.]NWG36798.1 hypothetical protein [Nitrososphaera sp.]